jgi:LysM repeat protein
LLPLVLVFPGCFATSKSLEDVQSDVTRKNAWANEELSRQQADIDELRAENEALRQRLDDLSDQFASLGGDVSTRLTELSQSDEQVAEQVRTALQSTGVLAEQRRQDREETLDKMNAILEEVLQENKQLRERIDALEKSAFTFGRMHKVKEGESVASIAKQYGVSAQAIVEANDLSDASLIQVGQDLLVPGTSGP